MSYPVPADDVEGFVRSVEEALRRPFLEWNGTKTVATFAPDLTVPEQATYTALLRLHRSKLGLTPAEFIALSPDLVTLRAFHQAASPTAAQNVAATKALIRVLRVVLD